MLRDTAFPSCKTKSITAIFSKTLSLKLIVNAKSIREGYLESGLRVEDAAIILNGVKDVEQKQGELRKYFAIKDDEVLILSAGRMESQKRFDRIIEIAKLLCPKHNKLRFMILGSGPLRDELQTQIESADLQERVHLGKFVRNFAQVVGDADLFLLTSDNEGSPNVLMEAMAAGVCCLSTPVGSVPQLFGDAFKVQLINSDDLETASESILSLVNNKEDRDRIGTAMKERILTTFSFEQSMREYEQLLAKLSLGRS